MKELPTNLTGLETIQWLWENENSKDRFIAYDTLHFHIMKIDNLNLNLYSTNKCSVSSRLYNDEIHSMGFCLNVIMNETWTIHNVSEQVFTKYNDNEYEITTCTPSSCSCCQYRTSVRKDQIGIAANIEYDEDEECLIEKYSIDNYIDICALDKQATGGIRHEWCMANTIIKRDTE